jgi:hypothetical protein
MTIRPLAAELLKTDGWTQRHVTKLFFCNIANTLKRDRFIHSLTDYCVLQHITYKVIRRAIFCLWLAVFVLVCLPFVGFGLYYDDDHQCVRYREAKKPTEKAYAYLYFTFGKRTFKWNVMVIIYTYFVVSAV